MNFQMYKLGLEKAEGAEIKLLTFTGSQRKQGNSRNNIHFCFTYHAKACDCVDHKKLWKIPFFSPSLMANRWGKNRNSNRFIFLGSKITAYGDCNREIRRHLLLGRKAMTNLENVLKNKELTLLKKVYLVKATVFPVVMCGCESWTTKKAEHLGNHAFEM